MPKRGMMKKGEIEKLPAALVPPKFKESPTWSRLDHLYRISKICAEFESLEKPLEAFFGVVSDTLNIRSAILIDEAEDSSTDSRTWIADDVPPEDLETARAHADEVHRYFQASRPSRPPTTDQNYIVIPLTVDHRPPFGILQLECALPVSEPDVAFISAIANHLAIAIDRQNTRQRETAVLRSLSEFTSVAAHDLKSPINSILAFSDLLRCGASPERRENFMERIRQAAERMNRLIDDLLDLSRTTSTKIRMSTFDLAEMAKEVWQDSEHITQEKNARIEIEPLPTVNAGRFQVRQILHNLIGNALKYSKSEVPPQITITGRAITVKGEPFVEITIADNGIGFSAENAAKIFEPFERLHGSDEYEGTGLGLAICRKNIERFGGTISATGTQGEGGAFIFTLPAAR